MTPGCFAGTVPRVSLVARDGGMSGTGDIDMPYLDRFLLIIN
jgi:hypothetical protein